MCFSPQVDLATGVVVGAIGVDAARHVRRPAQVPLAAIPLLLGVHQVIEAGVWFGLQGHLSSGATDALTHAYLLIALVVVPVLVPIAVGAIDSRHRAIDLGLTGLGVVVALVLLGALISGPVSAEVAGHHVEYGIDLSFGGLVVAGYVVAVCAPALLSRDVHVRWFGVANLVAVGALAVLASEALISLWCFWAAATSTAIAVHLRASVHRWPPRADDVGHGEVTRTR